ncbi:hypothetical protein [Nonomuraea pusilla]|uniref:PknH-like extracellular domain-containing protein n=1 Tax=Nonomuraea pusilla TaxID=46177 RepID=A0A1H7QFQ3_9ACTN|nr:hypothetical protein [Nonomuraea pusilla]SEL46931.1 hypothetical protein SAMN05660976_02537 [Nonomuraea pusilla]
MHKAISGICLTMLAVAGCASGQAAEAPAKQDAATGATAAAVAPAEAAKLRAALLPAPKGMRVTYGPETGVFGGLKSTQQGLAAIRQSKLERPECGAATQLDATKLAQAPAAVISFATEGGSLTQAVVSATPDAFPAPLPKQCASYQAEVDGTRVTYRTKALDMPKHGDQSRAYITTAMRGKGDDAQVGTVAIRRGDLITTMILVGKKLKPRGLYELGRMADQNLARVTR